MPIRDRFPRSYATVALTIALTAGCLALGTRPGIAAPAATLNGVVISDDGRPVENAKVTAANPILGAITVVTDHNGYFSFASLNANVYTLMVEAQQFEPYRRNGVDYETTGSISEFFTLRKMLKIFHHPSLEDQLVRRELLSTMYVERVGLHG